MKETILKSKTQFIITFAAIALMGSTLLMIVKPVSAQDGIQRPHGMRGQFRKHTEDKGNHRFRSAEQRMNRLQVIAGFLGLTPEVLKERMKNGENPHEIAQQQGKTREDFKTYIMDYVREHHWLDED